MELAVVVLLLIWQLTDNLTIVSLVGLLAHKLVA
jgi:hypothetical protein